MKKISLILALLASSLLAKDYYAKVEPYEMYNISSNVGGEVIMVNESFEGQILGSKPYILIDSSLDKKELKAVTLKLTLLKDMIKANNKLIKNYEEIVKRKQENYNRIKDLDIKSQSDKDREFYDLVSSQNQYISTLKEIDNLKTQEADLTFRSSQLNKSIKDKTLNAKGKMLYKLEVKKGQVVNVTTPLAKIADISKAKLELFLSYNELEDIKNKTVYIDGKKTSYKIEALWDVADEKHLSSYKARIIVKAPKQFSKLVKVEFK